MSMLLAAAADAANAAQAAAPVVADFQQKALVFAAAFSSIGFAAIGPVLKFGIPFLRKQKAFKKAEAAKLAAEQAEQQKDGAPDKAA